MVASTGGEPSARQFRHDKAASPNGPRAIAIHYLREEAGTHRYNVGTDTPKLCATSCGGVPLANSFLAALTLLSVIRRFRPPTRPRHRADSSPARVRSMINSRSIWARLAIT